MTDPLRAERAVIAALLVDPSRVPLVAGRLTGQDFAVRSYGDAFDAMVLMAQQGKRIDAVTLAANGHDLADVAIAESGTAVEDYAAIVREAAKRRSMAGHLDSLQRAIESGLPYSELVSQMADMTRMMAEDDTDTRLYDAQSATRVYQDIRERRKLQGVGLPYGISALDRWLQPAHGGDMVVVAARPSMGKTTLAEHIADFWAFEADYPVLFISIEMSLGQLMDRAVSRWGGIPASHIVRGILNDAEEVRVSETLERRQSVNIWYVDNPYATTDTVRAAAAEVRMVAGGIRAIVIDYLQLLKDGGDNDNQRIGRISRNVKALAREYDCPVLVLSQLNRQAEYREDPHPRLSDIRDSGAVEQDADVVLGLYRDRDPMLHDAQLDIDILKNRQGPLARVTVEFEGDFVRIVADE